MKGTGEMVRNGLAAGRWYVRGFVRGFARGLGRG